MKLKHIKLPLLLVISLTCAAVASWLLAANVKVLGAPDLPFGLFVTSAVAALLAIDPLIKFCRRKQAHDAVHAVHAQPTKLWHAMPASLLLQAFGSSGEVVFTGLTREARVSAAAVFGPNALPRQPEASAFVIFAKEAHEPQQVLLLIVGCLYALVGEVVEAALALGIIMLVMLAEMVTETRAKRAVRDLGSTVPRRVRVLVRDAAAAGSAVEEVDAVDLVPGDIVLLRAGDEVPADARLLSCSLQLLVDESKLTGESLPVEKRATADAGVAAPPLGKASPSPVEAERGVDALLVLPAPTPLAERVNMLHAGSVLRRGVCRALIVAIGPSTELGRTLTAVRSAGKAQKQKKTPLQGLLKRVATVATVAALLGSIVGGLLGFVRHMTWQNVVLAALSLAFATIPEELPILVAATLAVGAQSLSGVGIFVKRLRASEALACVDFVLTDKTGTLTEGRLRLKQLLVPVPTEAGSGDGDSRVNAVAPSSIAAFAGGATAEEGAMCKLLSAWQMMQESEGAIRTSGQAGAAAAAADPFDAAVAAAIPAALAASASPSTLLVDVPFDPSSKLSVRVFATAASTTTTSERLPPSSALLTVTGLVKGAPEAVTALCGAAALPFGMHDAVLKAAAQGQRVLAFASVSAAVPAIQLPALRAAAASADVRSAHDALQWLARLQPSGAAASAGSTAVAAAAPIALHAVSAANFLGALTFEDPLQAGVGDAVAQCASAGIRVTVITGDHPLAAAEIARQAGIIPRSTAPFVSAGDIEAGGAVQVCPAVSALPVAASAGAMDGSGEPGMQAWAEGAASAALELPDPSLHFGSAAINAAPSALSTTVQPEVRVFARAAPAHKLALVQALQAAGRIVAVTGDGLNDGPALAAADVGFAVPGATGVAKEAASIVVVQGGFLSLLTAVREGRRLRANLESALAFYLGAKAGLVILFIAGTLWRGFPLAPVQIILLELLMDLGASTSFVTEPAEAGVMEQPPRSAAAGAFFDRVMMMRIAACAASLASMVLSGFAAGLANPAFLNGATISGGTAADDSEQLERAQTVAFYCWLIGHVLLAVHQRTATVPLLTSKLCLKNPLFWAWLAAVGLIAALAGNISHIQQGLGLVSLSPRMWVLIVGICVVGTAWIEVVKLLCWCCCRRRGAHRRGAAGTAVTAASVGQASTAASTPDATVPLLGAAHD